MGGALLFPQIRLRLTITEFLLQAIAPMEESQTSDNELDTKKRGYPHFASSLPGVPEQRERRCNQQEGPADHPPALGFRLQPAFVPPAHERGDWWVCSPMAIKDLAPQGRDAFDFAATILLCFLKRIEDQATTQDPRIKVVPVARQIDSGLNVAKKDGILCWLDSLHPASWLAILVVESNFLHGSSEAES
jgi:hypothetical protein